MNRQLVRILGIEHHYLAEDWFGASQGTLSSDNVTCCDIKHKGELALYVPEFVYDEAINASSEREISFGNEKFISFNNPAADDYILIKLDIDFNRELIDTSYRYKGILAKQGEFEPIALKDLRHCVQSPLLLREQEAAIYLSDLCFTNQSLIDLIGYRRDSFSQEEIDAHLESLSHFKTNPRPGVKYFPPGKFDPPPGPRYKSLIQ